MVTKEFLFRITTKNSIIFSYKTALTFYDYLIKIEFVSFLYREHILKQLEAKINSSDFSEYFLLIASTIYFHEQVQHNF